MPNPTKRHSKSRRDKRRGQKGISPSAVTLCAQCHEPKIPHHICLNCGTYRSREYIPIEEA